MKTSLVTGATGQDGSYLIRKLLSEGRRVCALIRRASTSNMSRLSDLREGVQPNGSELNRTKSIILPRSPTFVSPLTFRNSRERWTEWALCVCWNRFGVSV